MCLEEMQYDQNNKQEPFTYIARCKGDGKLVIGYIFVEKPWYQPSESWKYYIYYNEYIGGGFCGGAVECVSRAEVDPITIVPYNQVAHIIYNLEIDIDSEIVLEKGKHGRNCTIKSMDDLYKLYELYDFNTVNATVNALSKRLQNETTNNKKEKVVTEKDKKEELYCAVTAFWNESKDKYSSIYIGLDTVFDFEEIRENEGGCFECTMFDKTYETFEEIARDVCDKLNPDEVAGFNYGEIRKEIFGGKIQTKSTK